MGSNTSKMSAAQTERLMDRLQALQLEEQEYVHIGEKGGFRREPFKAPWTPLDVQNVGDWERDVLNDPTNKLALSALTAANPKILLQDPTAVSHTPHIFNTIIPHEGRPITNQQSSGRCWLFASTNVFRVAIMKRYNLRSFELSQNYLFFWDKLEKANYFLEQIIDTASWDERDEGRQGRTVMELLKSPVGDGGQWDMVYNLVDKYGLIPHVFYPDTYNAERSSFLGELLTSLLRANALRLRALARSEGTSQETITQAKDTMMKRVHLILTLTLGPPPHPDQTFDWTYEDATGKVHTKEISPLSFARDLNSSTSLALKNPTHISSMISLIDDPRHEHYTHLGVSRLGNVVGGRGVSYVNVPMSTMKSAAIAMIREGLPVFFGCDVGKESDSARGLMVKGLLDYETGFGLHDEIERMGKEGRVRVGESAMTHAMVLTGVHLNEHGHAERWRVQNSWGQEAGEQGYFSMSDDWMTEYTFQVVVEPRFVTREVKDVLKKERVMLPLWDPMGALA